MGQELNGWLVAAVLFVLLIFRDVVKGWLSKAFSALGEALYQRLAGSRLLRRQAIARYRRSVAAGYGEFSAPFMDEKLVMRDVYLPLTVMTPDGKAGGQEVGQPIAEHLHTVVTGAPGAGKSMLLRHAMLSWATAGGADAPIPVLCELHRHSDAGLTLQGHLEQQLRSHDFPGAGRFLAKALQDGGLTVLLDGFDEVGTGEKTRVAQLVNDFAAAHPKVRMVVTCRAAAYQPQLMPLLTQRLQIGELTDRMVRHFLAQWPAVKGPQRVQQLMEVLRENPRLLQLARNPLQLTMIAYLHANADDRRQPPHSRSQCYGEAMSLLLRRLTATGHRFDSGVKFEVLQKAALAGMDSLPSLPRGTVADLAAQALPAGEPAQEASALLAEIEQTGLLVSAEGGEHYRFAHATLQEFLAARELSGKPEALQKRLHAEPSRWRESAILWCGITTKDCTKVVSAVFRADPVAGLECLADARVINADLAGHIVEESLARLTQTRDAQLAATFGLVAADPRPRGVEVYERLAKLATDGDLAAAAALAETNLPKAAELISALAADRPEARPVLVSMGELAVPALSGYAVQERSWAVDCLTEVATPGAIEALAEQLWAGPANPLATRAAWRLATLTEQPDVKAILCTVTKPTVRLGGYDWCWEPFAGPGQGSLPGVMAQICLLLDQPDAWADRPEDLPPIDPRIGIPLCLREVERTGAAELKPMRESLLAEGRNGAFQLARRRREHLTMAAAALSQSDDTGTFVALARTMAPQYQQQVTVAALAGNHFSRKEWAQLDESSAGDYRFAESARYRLLFAGACLTLLGGLALAVGIVSDLWPAWGPAWWGWLALAFLAPTAWVLFAYGMASTPLRLRWGVLGLLEYGESVMDGEGGDRDNIAMGVFGGGFALSVVLLVANGQHYLGWPATLGLAAAAVAGTVWLWVSGGRKEVLVYSPLARMLPALRAARPGFAR